jgi:hypothetical protein
VEANRYDDQEIIALIPALTLSATLGQAESKTVVRFFSPIERFMHHRWGTSRA